MVDNVTLLVIVLIVIAVIVVALVAFLVYRRRRQARAREQYGSEYERVVEERGSERKAEQELRERRERVEGEIQPLSEESRRRYDEQWQQVERTFVDDPAASLDDADRLMAKILTERNFPADSREEAGKGIGVIHPEVVEDFREAQRVHQNATSSEGGADLEEMRQAIQKYRSVYERLTER
jgi:type II secretory pathway pseudopilin PulG